MQVFKLISLASSITLIGTAVSITAMFYALEGVYIYATFLIFGSVFIDYLDGFVARKYKMVTPLGAQLDSLSDLVSFGILPTLIYYLMVKDFSLFYGIIAVIYSLSVMVRLARYNVNTSDSPDFVGLPAPSGAIFMLSAVHMNLELAPYFVILVSILMISVLPHKGLKKLTFDVPIHFKFFALLCLIAAAILVFYTKWLGVVILFGLYSFHALVTYLRQKVK